MVATYKIQTSNGRQVIMTVEDVKTVAHAGLLVQTIRKNNPTIKGIELIGCQEYTLTYTSSEVTNDRVLG